jgi:hypothetical protein
VFSRGQSRGMCIARGRHCSPLSADMQELFVCVYVCMCVCVYARAIRSGYVGQSLWYHTDWRDHDAIEELRSNILAGTALG